jgi:hypothetical protein
LKNEFGGYALTVSLEELPDKKISKGGLLPQRNLNRAIIKYVGKMRRIFQ